MLDSIIDNNIYSILMNLGLSLSKLKDLKSIKNFRLMEQIRNK